VTEPLRFTPRETALVLVDLQRGILQMPVAPHAAADVLARAVELLAAFRKAGGTVVLVRVSFAADGSDALNQPRDSMVAPARPPGWDQLAAELGAGPTDIVITKHQWGAFYGTELDLQLRRRGVRTVVIGGISTNFGVESTARDAFERGYALVFVEDAMASFSTEAHAFACTTIFPRLGRVRSTHVVLEAIRAGTTGAR
jgi:nicotinamidase-related amidase